MNPWLNFLARAASIAAMAISVIWLTHLFEAPSLPQKDHAKQSTSARDPIAAMADAWQGDIAYAPAYAALHPHADANVETAASAFDPNDDYWGLPRSEGAETVAAYCSACHSLQIVMTQRQNRDGWDYLLTWMSEKQGMAEPPSDMREEMLNYLAREFGG